MGTAVILSGARAASAVEGLAVVLLAMLLATPARAADHPDLFTLTSPDFADNAIMSTSAGGTGKSTRGPWDCGGQNISPALSWSHAPAGTKSFAVTMDDPDAASGIGSNHWIAYDIPATITALPRDAGNGKSSMLVGGSNGRNLTTYFGPCAEPGAKPHHFLWMVYALDISPGTLKPGLSREEFIRQIKGHNLAEASLSSRYEQVMPR
jgi:Raf kinase inhibitor-like YbhB/YbcL family protein